MCDLLASGVHYSDSTILYAGLSLFYTDSARIEEKLSYVIQWSFSYCEQADNSSFYSSSEDFPLEQEVITNFKMWSESSNYEHVGFCRAINQLLKPISYLWIATQRNLNLGSLSVLYSRLMPSINTFWAPTLNRVQYGHWGNTNKSTEVDKSIIECEERRTINKHEIQKDIKNDRGCNFIFGGQEKISLWRWSLRKNFNEVMNKVRVWTTGVSGGLMFQRVNLECEPLVCLVCWMARGTAWWWGREEGYERKPEV